MTEGTQRPAEPTGPGRVLVVIPTYDERENLRWIVGRVRAATRPSTCSSSTTTRPDGTGEIADELAAADPQVHVLHRTGKEGLGAAYLAGFPGRSSAGYDVIGEMDADGSHQPEQLPRLLDALGDADLVIGVALGARRAGRELAAAPRGCSRAAATSTPGCCSGIPVRDATGGYRPSARTTLETIDLDDVASQGYCFQTDLAWRPSGAGLRVVEVPIEFVERVRGDSKMSGAIVARVAAPDHPVGAAEHRRPAARRCSAAAGARGQAAAMSRLRPRRSMRCWSLLVLFVVVPVVEIYVLIQVGQAIGAWWTILLLIADSILGAWLIRREGAGPAWAGAAPGRWTTAGCRPASWPTRR